MKKVILDTDMANQVDDQFALTYLLNSLDVIELEAITIAPFSKLNTIEEGTELSYEITLKILELMNKSKYQNKVFKGATNYIDNNYKTNMAVEKIIDICLKNKETTIIAIGAITNVALAIALEPKIVDKLNVVWLGGNEITFNDNSGTNFKDIRAVKMIFESNVKLTVIPCKNVASNLITTIYELEHYMKRTSINTFLLDNLIKCDKNIYEKGVRKVLWDLSAVAYIINESWFTGEEISCYNILDDGSYEVTQNNHKVTFIKSLDRDKIFDNFFSKL